MDLMTSARNPEIVAPRSAAEPFALAGTIGLYEQPQGHAHSTAVLFCNPWGLEDMCTRRMRRIIAETLGDAGIASFRFDYPGTGNALDEAAAALGFESWILAFEAAADELKRLSNCQSIIVIAQGVGAIVAASACQRRQDVDAIALLAPAVTGRSFVRELSMMSRVVREKLEVELPEPPADGLSIAGLDLPATIVSDLKKISLTKMEGFRPARAIVFKREGNPGDQDLAADLEARGCATTVRNFTSYETLTTDPTVASVPQDVVDQLISWVQDCILSETKQAIAAQRTTGLNSESHFSERPLRFGNEQRLFGILCAPSPDIPKRNATVLLISAGYEPMWGWARTSVRLARSLAKEGISSLRFDCANIADSPSAPQSEAQVLYSEKQVLDVAEAVKLIKSEQPDHAIIATGRCSAAYLGFRSALAIADLDGAVIVNPLVFEWPQGKSVDEALRSPLDRSADHYYARLRQKGAWQRVLRGEVDVAGKLKQVVRAGVRAAASPVAHLVGGLNQRERSVYAAFRALARRSTLLTLIYSENDVGLAEFNHFFQKGGDRLKSYANVDYKIVEKADHNFTPPHAFESYRMELLEMVHKLS